MIPVRAVERVRIRTRLRRARHDFLPLYVGAGVAGVAFGFLLSVILANRAASAAAAARGQRRHALAHCLAWNRCSS